MEANPPKHPFYAHLTHHDLDPALLAKDTTCVDAIDKDGVAISITPSGAWLPSVIAGDTGIALTRARAELSAGGRASERTGARQAAARDAEPDAGDESRRNGDYALHARRRQSGSGACCKCCSTSIAFGMNAEGAVEAPRFQTEHLVSSFDNHAMSPGTLFAGRAHARQRGGGTGEARPQDYGQVAL